MVYESCCGLDGRTQKARGGLLYSPRRSADPQFQHHDQRLAGLLTGCRNIRRPTSPCSPQREQRSHSGGGPYHPGEHLPPSEGRHQNVQRAVRQIERSGYTVTLEVACTVLSEQVLTKWLILVCRSHGNRQEHFDGGSPGL